MKSYIVYIHVLADNGNWKKVQLKVSGEKHIILVRVLKNMKAAHPVNYFLRFLGKNIKNCPPSKLFLFTSLGQGNFKDSTG